MSDPKVEILAAQLNERLGEHIVSQSIDRDELTIVVAGENLITAALILQQEDLAFRQLSDLSGIDYLSFGQADWQTQAATDSGFSRGVNRQTPELAGDVPDRFAVVYQILSIKLNQRLRLKVYVSEESPRVDSVISIWPSADWYEREAFDLFGILFNEHPDLRRLLTDYGFIGHPFRKDFPLEGHVEVRYDLDKKRVVYQPVSIENRVLVPRVIREESRLSRTNEGEQTDA